MKRANLQPGYKLLAAILLVVTAVAHGQDRIDYVLMLQQTPVYGGTVSPGIGIMKMAANQPVTIYGNGKQTRCFLHVKDAVWAMMKLMQEPAAIGEVFNVGSQEEISVEDLAKRIIEIIGSKSELVYIPYDQAYEEGFEDMQRRVPDITKIANLIGFKPTYTLDNIIHDVIDYFKTSP